jgi:hypothetical protein
MFDANPPITVLTLYKTVLLAGRLKWWHRPTAIKPSKGWYWYVLPDCITEFILLYFTLFKIVQCGLNKKSKHL